MRNVGNSKLYTSSLTLNPTKLKIDLPTTMNQYLELSSFNYLHCNIFSGTHHVKSINIRGWIYGWNILLIFDVTWLFYVPIIYQAQFRILISNLKLDDIVHVTFHKFLSFSSRYIFLNYELRRIKSQKLILPWKNQLSLLITHKKNLHVLFKSDQSSLNFIKAF